MFKTTTEKPTTAFMLSLIGGIIVFLVGFFVMIILGVAALFNRWIGILSAFGFLGVIWGILMIVGAVMLYSKPEQHVTWGILILVSSFLSWIGTFGGLVVGFILGVIGGILGIIWRPSASITPTIPMSRICPNCGKVQKGNEKFCSYCGKELP